MICKYHSTAECSKSLYEFDLYFCDFLKQRNQIKNHILLNDKKINIDNMTQTV